MAKLPSSRLVERTLRRAGFVFVSQKGSHAKFRNSDSARMVIVPMGKQEIPIGTFRSIVRQSGLASEDFK